MNILVLYTSLSIKDRKTIRDSLNCFARYQPQHKFYYLPVQKPKALGRLIRRVPFDGVILHYTLLSRRLNAAAWAPFYAALRARLQAVQGVKVAIPQDEYCRADSVCQLARECGVAHIFTVYQPQDYEWVYPAAKTGGAGCSTVHTGYVDENSLALVEKLRAETPRRDIDIGYRARRLSYALGELGQQKAELAERFQRAAAGRPGLKTDISTTGDRKNALLEDNWYRFLLRCRVMPGCLGGASVLDTDGAIAEKVDTYVAQHPNAGFAQTRDACFPGQDYVHPLYGLGPRHFECAMTKTCQVLLEGDYFGVFRPGEHYIELKADYSNIDEVMEKIADEAYCRQIAQRCYDDVVARPGPENPNTYAWFANQVVNRIEALRAQQAEGDEKRFPRLRCGAYCAWVRGRTRLWLRLYNHIVMMYNGMSRFLASRPRAHKLAQKLFRRPFVPLGD